MLTAVIGTVAPPLERTGDVRIHDTHIGVWEHEVDEEAMLLVMRGVLGRLRSRGFRLERDPKTLRDYPTLANRTWCGRKSDLEVRVDTSGRVVEITFFQNVANVSNPNGGRFDHDRFARMPRRMRLQCIVEMGAVLRKLADYGYTMPGGVDIHALHTVRAIVDGSAEDAGTALDRFNRGWRADRFLRDATGWPAEKEYAASYNRDRDSKPLRNGMIRYFRPRSGPAKGRLLRGTIFTNMNTMWVVVDATGTTIGHVSCSELFECARPDMEPRRRVPGQRARIESELRKALVAQRFERVAVLARLLARMIGGARFFVRDTEKGVWWCEDEAGYTADITRAGRFTEEHARRIEKRSGHAKAVSCEEAAEQW